MVFAQVMVFFELASMDINVNKLASTIQMFSDVKITRNQGNYILKSASDINMYVIKDE